MRHLASRWLRRAPAVSRERVALSGQRPPSPRGLIAHGFPLTSSKLGLAMNDAMPNSRDGSVNSRGLSEREPVLHHHGMTITFRAVIVAALATACSHPTGAARLAATGTRTSPTDRLRAPDSRDGGGWALRISRFRWHDSSSAGETMLAVAKVAEPGRLGSPRERRQSIDEWCVVRRHAHGSHAHRWQAVRAAHSPRASRIAICRREELRAVAWRGVRLAVRRHGETRLSS